MNTGWRVLLEGRLRAAWNSRLRFGRSGICLILLEVLSMAAIVFWLGAVILPNRDISAALPGITGFLVAMNLLVGLGNSYIRAERALYSGEVRLDRILAQPGDVVFSALALSCLDNLRPTMQAPLLSAFTLSCCLLPEHALLLGCFFFILPLFSATLSAAAVILARRFMGGISTLFSIPAALSILSGLAGTAWLLLNLTRGSLPGRTPFQWTALQPAGWWPFAFLAAALIALFAVKRWGCLWDESLMLLEEQRSHTPVKKGEGLCLSQFLHALRLPADVQGLIFKEWQSLRRNPITKFRFLVWLLLSSVPFLHAALRSLITALPSLLLPVFLIWVFCFGEMIATAYQSEADRLGVLWLAAVSPGRLALSKFLAYLPLVFFALGSAGLYSFLTRRSGTEMLLLLLFTFLGSVSSIALSLLPAALSMNKIFFHSGSVFDLTLEQVPVTLPAVLSTIVLIGSLTAFYYLTAPVQNAGAALPTSLSAILAGSLLLTALAITATSHLLRRHYAF